MSEYINSINVNVADIVHMDFGCTLNGNTKIITSVAMNLDTVKALRDTLYRLIIDVEEKQMALKKAN